MGRGFRMVLLLFVLLASLCAELAAAQLQAGDALFQPEEDLGSVLAQGSPLFQDGGPYWSDPPHEGSDEGAEVVWGSPAGDVVAQPGADRDAAVGSPGPEGLWELADDAGLYSESVSALAPGSGLRGWEKESVAPVVAGDALLESVPGAEGGWPGSSDVSEPRVSSELDGKPLPRSCPESQPAVTCGRRSLTVRFARENFSSVYLLQARMTPLSLDYLPEHCGHRVWTTEAWLTLVASYRGCYVQTWRKQHRWFHAVTVKYYDVVRRTPATSTVTCSVAARRPRPRPRPPASPSVSCGEECLTATLPTGPLEEIRVRGPSGGLVSVLEAGQSCGYSALRGRRGNTLTVPYTACHVSVQNAHYTLTVVYVTSEGETGSVRASCPVLRPGPREGCRIPRSQRVSCGPEPLSPAQCLAKGCCVDPDTSSCYYPLEECTADKHFVFAVYRTSSVPPVDPASLVVAGNQSCAPVICTPDFAVFKIPVTGCGTHAFVVGETTIYLAEVEVLARRSSLNYGVITRDSPFRLLVECRYAEGSLASTGYLVKSPYLPSAVLSQGAFGVQLRIATDESYSRFYPQYHRPLRLLLGSPVHLEVRLLNAPDPGLVLLVHYCIAYPRSGQTVWVLLYEGCPNLLDYGHASTLHVHSQLPLPKHHRHFHIQTFQFLDGLSQQYLDEEIYFMCSTEVCLPSERRCVEGCFDGRRVPVAEPPDADRRCVTKPCPERS
ncbi:zona pellucida sperm-binding protein 4-like [Lepisosteus oculatus]|uniref:zona pellucida sperm-binding protein 4-like n=1 Tax=Lepisosteus oculatus TaxID=7918 RepID=UPI0037137715